MPATTTPSAASSNDIADVLRDLVLRAPPNLVQGWHATPLPRSLDGLRRRQAAAQARRSSDSATLLDLFAKSAGDYLDGWFESDPVKAVFGFDAMVGNYASPYTPGSAYVLLHHCFGEVNGKKGVWGHAIGGMGAITQAMATARATAHGAEIETDAGVREVIVEKGRAAGVVLEDGRPSAPARSSRTSIRSCSIRAARSRHARCRRNSSTRMKRWQCGSGTFRMNVALSELPSFTALPGREPADHHTAGIILAPSLAYMDRAYDDARNIGWSREPIVEMLIPSTLDDTLAPQGRSMSRACSASTSRRNCRTAARGTTTATRSPI